MSTKKLLRQSLQQTLQQKPIELYKMQSNQIASLLFNTEEWKDAQVVATTLSRTPEVDTYPIIHEAWRMGKMIAVPKCHPKTHNMTFHIIHSFHELETVFFGLLEPIVPETQEIHKDNIDLVIVPGLGFHTNGYRLGFGGGYYDRFLKDYKGNTVSLAFPEQVQLNIPIEPHDIPVGKLITPEVIINC